MAHRAVGISLVSLALAGALMLAGCAPSAPGGAEGGGEPVSGGTLTTARANPFEGFDLDKQTLNSSFQISQAVLETLTLPSEDGMSLAPGLASSWEFNDDNTELTIHIDPKAAFSDGAPVTADDVAFSVEQWKKGPNYGAVYAVVKTAETVDEKTVVLHLDYPATTLPALLSWASAGVLPKDFGGRDAADFWQKPIGAGAFVVEKWSANGEVVLKPNTHYRRAGLPYLDEVVSNYAADPNSVTLQLQSGQLDLADEIPPVIASSLPKNLVVKAPEHITDDMIFNTKRQALADRKVRQAIGYALDYQALNDTAFRGYGVVPTGALPTNSDNWAPPSKPYFSEDREKAKELLGGAEVGTLELIYVNDPSGSLAAQIIQDSLSQIGITVELRGSDAGTMLGAMDDGDFDLALFAYNAISPDAADPATFIATTNGMFSGASTDRLFELLSKYDATSDTAAKEELITKMQDDLFENPPFLALVHRNALEGRGTAVRGFSMTPWGTYDFATVWKQR